MKFKDDIIDNILKENWFIDIRDKGGVLRYGIYFEIVKSQALMRESQDGLLIDFADKDSLKINSLDSDCLVLSGKRHKDNEEEFEWILTEFK